LIDGLALSIFSTTGANRFPTSLVKVQKVKSHRTLLISLALNLVLTGVLFALHARLPKPPSVVVTEESPAAPKETITSPEVATQTTSNRSAIPFQWQMLETNDPRAYVAKLRGVLCPEHVLRELLVQKLEKHYRPKLEVAPVRYEPWIGRDRRDSDGRDVRLQVANLKREQAALIRDLLGYDWNSEVSREWSREAVAGVYLGFLTDLRAQQVMAQVMESMQKLEGEFSIFGSRIIIDDDLVQVARFRSDITLELGRFLTPTELDELETRAQLGLVLLDQLHLDGMDATGAELRAIMQASRSYRDFLTTILLERGSRNEEPDLSPKRGEFEAALVTSLGAARFAEFQRAQDKDFRDAFRFTKELELPRAVAVSLYAAQRAAEAQSREITSDPNFTAEERKAALEVLQTATTATVANALGKQFTNYFNGNGRWLKQLTSATTDRPVPREVRR